MIRVTLDVGSGERFDEVTEKAVAISRIVDEIVEFDFNDTQVRVNRNTDAGKLLREYWQVREEGNERPIGPAERDEPPRFQVIDGYQYERKGKASC